MRLGGRKTLAGLFLIVAIRGAGGASVLDSSPSELSSGLVCFEAFCLGSSVRSDSGLLRLSPLGLDCRAISCKLDAGGVAFDAKVLVGVPAEGFGAVVAAGE